MQLFNRYVSTRSLTVFAGELLLIFGSVALAAAFQSTPDLAANLWKIGLVTVICQLCLYYNDFYDLTLVHSSRELIVRLLQAAGAASIILAALYFASPDLMIGNGIYVSALFVFLVAILGWRLAFIQVTGSLRFEERIRVEDATTTYERVTGKILIDDLRPSWLIFSDGFRVSRVTRLMKRTIDLGLSLTLAVITLPLMLITALLVLLEDGRPVLYRQERVGESGRTFVLSKFRSMRKDAEKGGTPIWARDGDDRITRVGRFIRKTRLDELPQLYNVLRGDMSFVGPRPERPFFVEQLSKEIPFYQQRHAVKPGLTGWAQVKYRYGSSLEDAMEKLRYDLYYIKHLSVFFDLTIVFDTVKVVLFRKGAA
jgi:lipopolysaccharide/colanic/teichoic acid biosynthesis glycosyltransferase